MSFQTAQTLKSAGPRAAAGGLLVVCLCAEWCDTCRDFKSVFARLAEGDGAASYVWLDIEDDSALLGDIDIENFPTLAVFRGAEPLFYGVTLPQEGVVQRTVEALRAPDARSMDVPADVAALPGALAKLASA